MADSLNNSCECAYYNASSSSKASSSFFIAKKSKKLHHTTKQNSSDQFTILNSFNHSNYITEQTNSKETEGIFIEIINNPSWGWILFALFVLIFYREKIQQLFDILILKIKNSKTISIPSFFSMSMADPVKEAAQGSHPTDQNNPTIFNDYITKKILSTLWHYQKSFGKNNNHQIRWSFIEPNNSEFSEKADKLCRIGLVTKNNQQYMLTNQGILFCKNNEEQLNFNDLYNSFLK